MMGSFISRMKKISQSNNNTTTVPFLPPTVKVITLAGALVEYDYPLPVSEIISSETSTDINNSNTATFFVCDSDQLYSGVEFPAMRYDEYVELGSLYFVLPASKLKYPLTDSDMASLAVKASAALMNTTNTTTVLKKKKQQQQRRSTVAPADQCDCKSKEQMESFRRSSAAVLQKKNSFRRPTNASRQAKSKRPFRPRLSTIIESEI